MKKAYGLLRVWTEAGDGGGELVQLDEDGWGVGTSIVAFK